MTPEEIGRSIKKKYPSSYWGLSDREVGQKFLAKQSRSNLAVTPSSDTPSPQEYSNVRPIVYPSVSIPTQARYQSWTPFLYGLAVCILIGSFYFLYNADQFWQSSGWHATIVVGGSLGGILGSLVLFAFATKHRKEEHQFQVQRQKDQIEIEDKTHDLIRKKTSFEIELDTLIAKARNEITVANAASREFLDPQSYLEICRMNAQSGVYLREKGAELQMDVEHRRQLQNLELEAKKQEHQMIIEMANIKTLMPFHEVNVLNIELAGMSLQLETAEKMLESDHKLREIKRITEQMKVWSRKINARQKRLL